MKWLTQKQVNAAAKKSDKAALDCSIEHWQQICDATDEELRRKCKYRQSGGF